MSFLFNPMGYYQPSSNIATYSTTADYPKYRSSSSSYAPQPQYRVNYNAYQEVAQFKVFTFEKLNRGLDWSNATSIYRFELIQNRSFGAFLNELKNHGISLQSHKFCYLDDEKDLVVLSTEYDFKYMLQIMKGKTIKIACEKVPQVLYNYRFAHPRASTLRNLPFFVQPSVEKQEEKREETLIEKALESVFTGIFEEKKQEETPQRRIHCMFPRPKQEQGNPRIRTIRLSDLLKQKAEESQQSQKEEQVEKRSFEDYLAELFGRKLAERKSQDENQEQAKKEATNESNEKKQETVTETTVEQPVVEAEKKEEKSVVEEKPVLSTSQIISNYLIEDEDSEDEEDSFDENSSVTSEQSEVQYPTFNVPEEEQTLPSSEEELQRFEKELKLLSDMGFNDTIENLKLLNKYNGDIQRSVSELIYYH